jgi:hypothetical protein
MANNAQYRLEITRAANGLVKVNSAERLINVNQHKSFYENVNKSVFSASMSAPKAARRISKATRTAKSNTRKTGRKSR